MGWRTGGERGALRLDPRLLIGLLLVAGSTVGVWALVAGIDDTVEVYAVRDTLATGTPVDADDLQVVQVRLGAAGEHYLAVDALPADGAVLARTVGAGELLPVDALADPGEEQAATVVVTNRGPLSSKVRPGARVDVWAADAAERGVFEAPSVLVAGAEVSSIREGEGLGGGPGDAVELLVPREKVAVVLEALASGDAIDLVPARAGR